MIDLEKDDLKRAKTEMQYAENRFALCDLQDDANYLHQIEVSLISASIVEDFAKKILLLSHANL